MTVRLRTCLAFAAFLLIPAIAHAEVSITTFTLQYAWYPTIEYSSFYLGRAQNYFADDGIALDFQPWKLGMNGVDEVAKGRADIGVDDAVNFLMAVDKGADLVAIYGFMQETPLCLVSLRHKLERIEDLDGKKVATVKGFQYLADYFRLKYPLLKDKVEFQLLDDNLGALQRGDADIGIFFETAQVPLLKLRGYHLNVLRYQDIGYDVYSHIIFVRRDFYEKNKPALQRFVKALHRSIGKTFEDPRRTVAFFAKLVKYTDFVEGPFKSEVEYERYLEACLKILHYYMTKGVGENYGLMNRHRWQAMVQSLRQLGLLDKEIPADSVFTNELLKGVYETPNER
jgi:ABC-type nitrate/sulfonate/bicarbonate transport system substrate-binding protein